MAHTPPEADGASQRLIDPEPPRLLRRLHYLTTPTTCPKIPTDAAFMSIDRSSKVVQ